MMMSEHKLDKEARIAGFKVWLQRRLRIDKAVSLATFTPHPRKPRLSKRGEQHPSCYTKRWTPSRLRDREEVLNG